MKLGKRLPRHDQRTLRLTKYLLPTLPPAPTYADFTHTLGKLGMMANDRLGDCTCAGAGHMIQTWTGVAQPPAVVLPDDVIIKTYEATCGYNPADPATDQGGILLNILNYWRQIGIGDHKISAFMAVNIRNHTEVMQALNLFGGLYTGVALPLTAQGQVGGLWDLVGDAVRGSPYSWGGHCIPIAAATLQQPKPDYQLDTLTAITWGALQRMTWSFWDGYVDECYAVLTPDWIEQNGKSPTGFDLETLQADLALLT